MASLVASGCNLSPHHLQALPSRNSPVPVAGYTTAADDTVRVECRKYTTVPQNPPPQWALVDTIVASNSPVSGTTDLYSYSDDVVFPNSCWGLGGFFAYATEVRFINNSGIVYGVFDVAGQSCVFQEYQAGTPYSEIRDTCELKDNLGQPRNYIHLVVE